MITFFGSPADFVFAVQSDSPLTGGDNSRLEWLFGDCRPLDTDRIGGVFTGPRAAMITPWSTNAVEITQNMGIAGISRIERFDAGRAEDFDPMLQQLYDGLDQDVFRIEIDPEPIRKIDDIAAYNEAEGLALNDEEVAYLERLSERLGRKLTDSEVFGFSQVNSEHCRHKIFNGTFVIDGVEKDHSLFALIKRTSREHPNEIVSAYKDNVAFLKGPHINQFSPAAPHRPDLYVVRPFDSVVSLKAETHNFPTTVEPFNGAATGSGSPMNRTAALRQRMPAIKARARCSSGVRFIARLLSWQ
ncbi:MAG: hypothetical protein R3350_08470 [Saprospiraceae bacterium]|nr:hypothetical protein [Saprospiraceae bacterium]